MTEPSWKPDPESLKELIRDTIKAGGGADASQLPSAVKERLKGRLTGDIDLDAYVAEVLEEMKRKG
ncbi:MAG: hypothetical protein AAGC77_12465 [Pseudomonadota bacterium]